MAKRPTGLKKMKKSRHSPKTKKRLAAYLDFCGQ
jgi:hypothetical protein